jgi:pimeloyl-ACP methyl ester carboxylesterase
LTVRDQAPRGGRFLKTAVGVTEYAEAGEGVPLLAIHGAGGGFDQGVALAREFVGDGYRIIAPSRFGYLGMAVPRDVSPAAQADAHAALLDALQVGKAIVLGFSAGARSAIELALRHPQRVSALVLIVPATYSPNVSVSADSSLGSRLALRAVSSGMDFAWWAAGKLAPLTLIRFLGVPPAVVARATRGEKERAMRMVESVAPLSLRSAGIAVDSNPPNDEPPFEKITAPTLIVSARDDLFKTAPAAEYAASRIPGAKLILFDDGGHLLIGHANEARAAARAFLAEAAARRRPPRRECGAPAHRAGADVRPSWRGASWLWQGDSGEVLADREETVPKGRVEGLRARPARLQVIEVAAGRQRRRIVAGSEPDLGEMRLVKIVGRARAAHPGRRPSGFERVGPHVRPEARDGESEHHIMELAFGVGGSGVPASLPPEDVVEAGLSL